MVVLWLVPLMRVVGRGSVDGWLGALLCRRVTGRAVRRAGEQRRETDRDYGADLSGPPGQLGEAAKPRVPRGRRGMAGPHWVTGAGIVVCPALAPEWHRLRGVRRLAGKNGWGRVGVVRRPVGGTALQVGATRHMAVGVVWVGVLRCPVSWAEPMGVAVMRGMARIGVLRRPAGRAEGGSAGRLWRLWKILAQAAVDRARMPDLGIGRLAGAGGVVLALAGGRPVRVVGLPGPVVCRGFIAVTHIRQHSTARVKGS